MDPRAHFEALYQEALRLKAGNDLAAAQQVETQAADFIAELEHRVEAHPDDPQASAYLLFLAERQWNIQGDAPEVQGMLERVLAMREKSQGAGSPGVAEALGKLADFHLFAGRWKAAEPLYRKALGILKE